MTMDMRLGGKDNSDSSWKEIARSTEQREHHCRQVVMACALRTESLKSHGMLFTIFLY